MHLNMTVVGTKIFIAALSEVPPWKLIVKFLR